MSSDITFADVLRFWLDEVGPKGWYEVSASLDETIRARFLGLWSAARQADAAPWWGEAKAALASLILLDQFPRNMHRDGAEAFATDALALRLARQAVEEGLHSTLREPEQQFFFMPFCHSETLTDQDDGVALLEVSMPGSSTLLHAQAHREVIIEFGRFPFRNKALDRDSTPAEQAFLDRGGYGSVVRRLQDKGAA